MLPSTVTVAATRLPLIAICGTTGVGKSQLSIELALALSRRVSTPDSPWVGARVINADAMQCYAGMDIITNKVPTADMHGVEHLLMGHKQPGEQYVVGQWVQDATKAIDETHRRKQIPIVVGGTSYWIQHLLFPNRLAQPDLTDTTSVPVSNALQQSIDALSQDMRLIYDSMPEYPPSAADEPALAFSLHSLLTALDPPVAARWHWRDTRKVLRNLHIMKETGFLPSDIMASQSRQAVEPKYHTLLYWLYAEPDVLNSRLDERVDSMIKAGLLDEIRTLHTITTNANTDSPVDYTVGIYQSIGYKEFHGFLTAPEPSAKLFDGAVERMKISTRQYARRQISWIRNKLLPLVYQSNAAEPSTIAYLLDATELGDAWHKRVLHPALTITEDFLTNRPLPDASSLSPTASQISSIAQKPVDPHAVLEARRKIICPVCTADPAQPCMIEEGPQWAAHERTKVHRRLAARAQRAVRIGEEGGSRRRERQSLVSVSADDDDTEPALDGLFQ